MVRSARVLTRKSMALLTSLLLVLFWVPGLIAATPASADAGSSIPGSPYNGGDGTIPDGNASIHSSTDPAGSLDTTSFTGGKEDDQCPGVTTQGLASPKDDLTKVYFGSENGTTAATSTDVFLYLAWERSTTSGTTTIDFELNQATGAMSQCNGVNPERTQGDLLFTYDFSNGGGSVDVHYYTWDTSLNNGDGGWKAKGDITSLVDINNDPVVEAATDNTGIKGEMAVNLSLLPGVFTADTCKDFGTAWAKTRSSTSFSSEIKDYVTPRPSVISNCAPLEILKEDSGTTPLAGATFSITANAGTHAVPSGQSPCTTRSDGYCYVEIPNSSPTAYAFPLLFPGSYHVVETAAPPGYLLPSQTAFNVTVPQSKDTNGDVIPLTVHDPLGDATFTKTDAFNSSALGGATFEIKATAGAAKDTFAYDELVTDNGSADATHVADADPAAGSIKVAGLYIGQYDVTETNPPAGYNASSATLHVTVSDANPHGLWSAAGSSFADPRKLVSLRVIKEVDGTTCDPANPDATKCLSGATFHLFRLAAGNTTPNENTPDTDVGNCTTDSTGACSLSVVWGPTYYWVETAAPAGYNLPAHPVSALIDLSAYPGTSGPDRRFDDSKPTITTAATDAVIGHAITDSATLSNVPTGAHGTVTFTVYGPFTNASDAVAANCTPANLATGATNPIVVNVTNAAAAISSGDFPTSALGYYAWKAVYSGDAAVGAAGVAGVCGDLSGTNDEVSQVTPQQPSIHTEASDTNTVDGALSDKAILTDFYGTPSGNVTFTLYKSCGGAVYGSVTLPIGADGTVSTAGHAATTGTFNADNNGTGDYFWSVAYANDTNNKNVSEACGGTNETSHAPVLDSPHKYNDPGTAPGASTTNTTVSVYTTNNQIHYTITVNNSGSADMNGVTVTDTLDSVAGPPVRYLSSYNNDCNANCVYTDAASGSIPAHTLTWTFNLAHGTSKTLTFSVTVNPDDLRSDVIHNHADVKNGAVTKSTEIVTNPVAYPDLSINKCAVPAPQSIPAGTNADCTLDPSGLVAPGSSITYALTVSNTGDAAASGVKVTDAVPALTSFASCDSSCSHTATTVTWTVTVPAGGSVTVHFTVNVASSGLTNGDHIDNVGSFTWSNSGSTTTSDQSGTSATVRHLVGFPVIGENKFANPLPIGDPIPGTENTADGIVHLGDTITYTVQATNSGLASSAVTITDAIPDGTTYVALSAKCDAGAPQDCSAPASPSGGVLTWTMTLPGTSSATVSFQVTVNSGDTNGQILSNHAVVNDHNTRTVTHEVTFPIVTAVKSSDPATGTSEQPTLVGPNTVIHYTVAVTNSGLQDAAGVTVTDQVPTGTTYNDDASCGSAPNCSVQENAGLITWTLDVPAGTTQSVTFSVTTPTVQSALIDNTASFTNLHGCTVTEANTCDTNTTHHEVVFPVINAHKTSDPASGTQANPATVTPGQVITYTIAVTNSGQADATGVVVKDSVPANTTYVAGSADATGGTVNAGVITWTINVAKGATVNLTFQAQVPAGAGNGTLIDNTATFTNVHTPGCTGETCSTETTHHEVRFPVLTLAKSSNPVSGSIVQRGDRIDYTITLANAGLDASAPTTITDTLPTNVTIVSGSASPAFTTVNGNVVTWTVTVPAGQTKTLTYGVTVNSDAPQGATLTNVALINGQCVGNTDESACTTDHHVPTGALTLVKHVDKATASYGDTLTYTFDASTTGALDQTGVVVTDVLPKGTAYVSGSAACTDAGTCTASFDATSKTVTWQLGDMAAGTTRHLVFKVTIVKPSFNPTTGLPATTIVNSGAVRSNETPNTPSNQVVTKVVEVLGVKVVRPPVLAFTGLPAQVLLTMGLLMLGAGIILTSVRRKEQ